MRSTTQMHKKCVPNEADIHIMQVFLFQKHSSSMKFIQIIISHVHALRLFFFHFI